MGIQFILVTSFPNFANVLKTVYRIFSSTVFNLSFKKVSSNPEPRVVKINSR